MSLDFDSWENDDPVIARADRYVKIHEMLLKLRQWFECGENIGVLFFRETGHFFKLTLNEDGSREVHPFYGLHPFELGCSHWVEESEVNGKKLALHGFQNKTAGMNFTDDFSLLVQSIVPLANKDDRSKINSYTICLNGLGRRAAGIPNLIRKEDLLNIVYASKKADWISEWEKFEIEKSLNLRGVQLVSDNAAVKPTAL